MALNVQLFEILRSFSSLTHPGKISFPKNISLSLTQEFFLEHVLLNPHFHQYPPSNQYQRVFWKWAIQHLENSENSQDFEIDSRIYNHYLSLLQSSENAPGFSGAGRRNITHSDVSPFQKPPDPSFVTHFWGTPKGNKILDRDTEVDLNGYETVTLLESRTTVESGTTGMRTWLASLVLAEYLSENPDLVKSQRILELGCGIGFLGIILARLQQTSPHSSLWLTDVNDEVLERCRYNVQMPCNKLSLQNIYYHPLNWSDSLDIGRIHSLKSLLQDEIDADIIIGADIIFDPSSIPAIAEVLRLALQPKLSVVPSKMALFAMTVRNESTFRHFLQAVRDAALQVQELQVNVSKTMFFRNVGEDIESVKIFQFTS